MSHSAPKAVADVFRKFPTEHRNGLKRLRTLILDLAQDTEGANPLEETLKWGQPSYIAPKGSTIRLGITKDAAHHGLYFTCSTNILTGFQDLFPTEFQYDGNRAILFAPDEDQQPEKLSLCIIHALTYHQRK